jgi:hypothetical protein
MVRSLALFCLAFGSSLLFGAPGAAAAPQLLGLVASNEAPTRLDCSGDECSAYVGSFCMQPGRDSPSRGTPYEIVGGSMTLRLAMADGSETTLDAASYVQILAHNQYSAVRVALPSAGVEAMGAVSASIEIGRNVTVAPRPQSGDLDPQSPEEIALAVGPLREAGALAFDRPGRLADATRIVARLINDLPKVGGEETRAIRDGLWEGEVGNADVAMATPEGRDLARSVYDGCLADLESQRMPTMRTCLSLRHGELMREANHSYWDLIGGS